MRKLAYNGKEPQLRGVKTRLFCRPGFYLDINSDCKIIGVSRKDLQKRRDKNEEDEAQTVPEITLPEEVEEPLESKPLESKPTEIKTAQIDVPSSTGIKFKLPPESPGKTSLSVVSPSTKAKIAHDTDDKEKNIKERVKLLEKNKSVTSATSSANINQPHVATLQANSSTTTYQGKDVANSSTGAALENEAIFFLIPVGLRIVAVQHQDTGLYIAMDPDGKLYTCEMFTAECKFKEACAENYYVVYSSVSYKHKVKQRALHIGINDKGRVVRGTKAQRTKECAHFLPEPLEVVMMREPSSYEIVGGPSRSTTASNTNLNSYSEPKKANAKK